MGATQAFIRGDQASDRITVLGTSPLVTTSRGDPPSARPCIVGGRTSAIPVVLADCHGERYIVSIHKSRAPERDLDRPGRLAVNQQRSDEAGKVRVDDRLEQDL